MDIFLRNKFLLRIIVVLVLFNLCSTGYLWYQGKTKEGPGDRQVKKEKGNISRSLAERLHFTREQEASILRLRKEFSEKEEQITQMIKSQRDSMNVMMFHEKTDTLLLKQIAWRIAMNEYQQELLRVEQSESLKKICTEEQLKDFQHLVINIRDFFQPARKKE